MARSSLFSDITKVSVLFIVIRTCYEPGIVRIYRGRRVIRGLCASLLMSICGLLITWMNDC